MTSAPIVVHRSSLLGGRRVTVHSSGRDEILGTAYSDHDLVVFLEGAGVAEPDAILDDPQWVEWRGGHAHEFHAALRNSPCGVNSAAGSVPAMNDLDADEAWERLRASRSEPPARANTGSRGKTYSAALEQAQQLFRAAAVVGPATSPVLAFYGLSQAGRAITAAAWSLKNEDWRLDTHGIKSTGFHLPFPDIEIRTDPLGTQGSFVKVSEVLDSPVWERDPLRLEDIWDLLPPNLRYPLTTRNRLTPLYTVGDDIGVGTHEHSLLSVPVCDLPDRVIDAGTREALADFLTSYPAVAQHESYVTTRALSLGPEAPPEYTRYNHGGGELVMNWLMPEGVGTGFDGMATSAERLAHLRTMTRAYAGSRYFLPVLGSMKRDLHPLMAWWAVLYTLSMLARYEPAAWGALINVDNSRHAVPIERLLERAINHLPVLIADAITEVST